MGNDKAVVAAVFFGNLVGQRFPERGLQMPALPAGKEIRLQIRHDVELLGVFHPLGHVSGRADAAAG